MKYILYILIILCFFSCENEEIQGNAGSEKMVKSLAVYCLRDMLIGEDAGGHWEVLSQPMAANIDTLLIGDNPCIQWTPQPCGQYELMYIVGDTCCRDTSIVRPLKCCMAVTVTGDSLLCFGQNSTLTANASLGTAPYTYSWSGGGTSMTKVVSSSGTFTVTVTDASGCTKTDSHVVTVNPNILITLTDTDGSCGILGSITTSVSGGTPTYTYLWSSGETSANISGLANGTYTLTVTDSNGCTKSSSAIISDGNGPTVTIGCGEFLID